MTTATQVLQVARTQIGVRESPPGTNRVKYCDWYGMRGPWCAMFTSWCLQQAGMPRNALTHFAYTPSGYNAYRQAGRWHEGGPRPGDLVFFAFSAPSSSRPRGISHVGFVEAVEPGGAIVTVEGNTDEAGGRTGGRVMRKRRTARIVGYGRPAYSSQEPQEDEDMPLSEEDIDKVARRVADLFQREGLAPATKEDIADRVWKHDVHGKPAENRLTDADIRTAQLRKEHEEQDGT